MGNSKTGGDDDIDAKGKYLLLSVPEFGEDPVNPGKLMTSYLRLGAASTTWKEDPGGELAANIALSGPPGAHLSPTHLEVDIDGDVGKDRPIFVDDTRGREGCPDPHGLPVDERLAQSKVLHTRGGWRDHSDGNRISTTYGDKIEVIRGNYKMVVLGRQDDPTACAGWDASGQHIQDFANTMPGASVRVEWVQEYDGSWHLQNTTEGVVQSSNFAGDFYEFWWGDHHETTIGSENPVYKLPEPDGRPRANPHIIEKTWAERIEAYTGSSAWRVPRIDEETWADRITSLTDAANVSETTKVSETLASRTTAKTITDRTEAETITEETEAKAITSNTISGTITELTEAAAIAGTTIAGVTADVTVAGVIADVAVAANKSELYVGLSHINVEVCPLSFELFVGGRLSVTLGWTKDLKWPKKDEISIEKKVAELQRTVVALQHQSAALEHKVLATRLYLGIA